MVISTAWILLCGVKVFVGITALNSFVVWHWCLPKANYLHDDSVPHLEMFFSFDNFLLTSDAITQWSINYGRKELVKQGRIENWDTGLLSFPFFFLFTDLGKVQSLPGWLQPKSKAELKWLKLRGQYCRRMEEGFKCCINVCMSVV